MSWRKGAKARAPGGASGESSYCQSRCSCSSSGWLGGSTGPSSAGGAADDDGGSDSDVGRRPPPHCYTNANDCCSVSGFHPPDYCYYYDCYFCLLPRCY